MAGVTAGIWRERSMQMVAVGRIDKHVEGDSNNGLPESQDQVQRLD
jgi:hypothetical protein